MKSNSVVVLLAVLGCAGVALLWISQLGGPQTHAAGSGKGPGADEGGSLVASRDGGSEIATRESDAEAGGVPRPVEARDYESGNRIGVASPGVDPVSVPWPVKRTGRAGNSGATAGGEPSVSAELAFKALQYVGVDPEATKTWLRSINDPNTSAVDRGDLIEDLNEEGYLDNSRPTKEDLPLILARLELIERLFPYAADQVNADAFEEAYKDLLNMYIRLGGEPRRR